MRLRTHHCEAGASLATGQGERTKRAIPDASDIGEDGGNIEGEVAGAGRAEVYAPGVHYVTSIDGTLDPAPAALPGDSIPMGGWLITVTGGGFKAMPPSESRWSLEEAQGELDRVMAPVLSALAFTLGMKITMRVTSAHYADSADPNTVVLSTGFLYATASGVVAIASGTEEAARFVRRCEWADRDPLYRDLLDLLTEANEAANPRPAAFKLTERLEKKFGGLANAKKALGLPSSPFTAISRDQDGRYEGDRHAKYEIGHRPPPMDAEEREKVLAAARLIVEKYEAAILKGSGAC